MGARLSLECGLPVQGVISIASRVSGKVAWRGITVVARISPIGTRRRTGEVRELV